MDFEKCLDKNGKYKTTKANQKLLFNKVFEGDIEFLTKVLDASPEMVDLLGTESSWYRDKTPLMYAFQCNRPEVCRFMLDRGADVNFQMPDGPKSTVCGRAAAMATNGLQYHKEFFEIFKRIMKMGADATVGNPLWDAVHNCAYASSQPKKEMAYEVIEMLMDAGADPNKWSRHLLLHTGSEESYVEDGVTKTKPPKIKFEVLERYGITQDDLEEFKRKQDAPEETQPPFLEHPNGDHKNAKAALIDAMQRLDELGKAMLWIQIEGQGRGATDDQYECKSVAYRNGMLKLNLKDEELEKMLARLKLPADSVPSSKSRQLNLKKLTPAQRGAFLNDVFLKHFKLKPTHSGKDYGVVVEWKGP